MGEVDWASVGVMLGVGGLLWRQIHAVDARVAALAVLLADVDRRLARVEGWIEGERAGRAAGSVGTAPTKRGEVVHG